MFQSNQNRHRNVIAITAIETQILILTLGAFTNLQVQNHLILSSSKIKHVYGYKDHMHLQFQVSVVTNIIVSNCCGYEKTKKQTKQKTKKQKKNNKTRNPKM